MKKSAILHYHTENNCLICTISRPEALNALNSSFFDEFNEMLDSLESPGNHIRALVITGEGKAFVAGADIAEMQHMEGDAARAFSLTGQQAFSRLVNLAIPVIAAVNGYALGGGCELALACDIRLAGKKAIFGMPEAKLGLIPGYGGTQRLPKAVGTGNALYLLMTGDTINADEALRIGLVQKVLDDEHLHTEAVALANRIASQGPDALRTVKNLVHLHSNTTLDKGISIENESFPGLFSTDGPEGIRAFLEKRKPEWKSKKQY